MISPNMINDLPNVSDRLQVTIKKNSVFKGQDYDILIDLCITELENFKLWSKSNRLSINSEEKKLVSCNK